jgi:hypothetical protein
MCDFKVREILNGFHQGFRRFDFVIARVHAGILRQGSGVVKYIITLFRSEKR